jgi:hypothetical protein
MAQKVVTKDETITGANQFFSYSSRLKGMEQIPVLHHIRKFLDQSLYLLR